MTTFLLLLLLISLLALLIYFLRKTVELDQVQRTAGPFLTQQAALDYAAELSVRDGNYTLLTIHVSPDGEWFVFTTYSN